MPNYDPFMTPGSAVADQLQEILANRRQTARQAMLDQLNSRNVESEINNRDANSASLTQERIERENNMKAMQLQRLTQGLSPHQSIDPTTEGQIRALPGGNAMIDPGQAEQPQFDYEGEAPIPATGPSFHGRPADLEKEHDRKRKDDYMRQLMGPSYDKLSPTMKELVFFEATGRNAPASLLESDQPLTVFDQENGTFSPAMMNGKPVMGKKGERPVVQTRPPREPQDKGTYLGPAYDPVTNQPIPGKVAVMKNGSIEFVDSKYNIGPKPRAAAANALPYDKTAMQAYIALRNQKRNDPAHMAALNEALGRVISTAPANIQASIMAVTAPFKNQDDYKTRKHPSQMSIQELTTPNPATGRPVIEGASPEELQQINQILMGLRGVMPSDGSDQN